MVWITYFLACDFGTSFLSEGRGEPKLPNSRRPIEASFNAQHTTITSEFVAGRVYDFIRGWREDSLAKSYILSGFELDERR
jgi:hypothetical protein